MKLLFLESFQSHTGCERGGLESENLDLTVREKAHDRDEGWASPGCRCLHRGSSRAHLCSLEIHSDSFHISPHPPAPL